MRRERCSAGLGLTIVYVSDLHFSGRWTQRVADQVVDAITTEKTDVILLGGDLVDRPSALPILEYFLAKLARGTGVVLAIPGNHDQFVGEDRVRQAVVRNGGLWLPDGNFYQPGLLIECPVSLAMAMVCPDAVQSGVYRILCAHYPSAAPMAVAGDFDLVLAGHLHGCQAVLWERGGQLFPGAWFYQWNGRRFVIGTTTLLVSQGANDTFPLRWNCPREIIVCSL